MPKPKTYYHFTCEHGAHGIQQSGVLRPNVHPLLGANLVWLTDLAEADRWGLGLTSNWLSCDRTLFRVSVQPSPDIVRWPSWALWRKVPRALIDLLAENTRPEHWWVAGKPLKVSSILETTRRRALRSAS